MERLASGNAAYETPDAQISENKITVELEQGSFTEGEIKRLRETKKLQQKGAAPENRRRSF